MRDVIATNSFPTWVRIALTIADSNDLHFSALQSGLSTMNSLDAGTKTRESVDDDAVCCDPADGPARDWVPDWSDGDT